MSLNISSKIVSKLGSPESRIPLAAKDIFNSAGYTYFSYGSGGEIEAKDRLLDEVGTGCIWLFGIPFYRKIIDKTVFKKFGISPEADIRMLKNKDYYQKALKHAPTAEIKEEILNAGKNFKLTKTLNLLKFGAALALTMASYFGLTKVKQYMTKKNIEKEFVKETETEKELKYLNTSVFEQSQKSDGVLKTEKEKKAKNDEKFVNLKAVNLKDTVFSDFSATSNKKSTPSFGAINPASVIGEFILNPVKNMIILDTGISSQRIISSRTKEERKEYAIKEGAFLFFVYGADRLIKKGINAFTEKVLKLPTALEADFLASDLANKVLTDKNTSEKINEFVNKFGNSVNDNEIYDFIFSNPEHIIVKSAKKSGIIQTIKKSDAIDSRKYIDPEKIKNLGKDLKAFMESEKAVNNDKYLNKVKALKVITTLLNVAICCFALGYAVPKYIYSKRDKDENGKSGYHVKEQYMKELKAQKLTADNK